MWVGILTETETYDCLLNLCRRGSGGSATPMQSFSRSASDFQLRSSGMEFTQSLVWVFLSPVQTVASLACKEPFAMMAPP